MTPTEQDEIDRIVSGGDPDFDLPVDAEITRVLKGQPPAELPTLESLRVAEILSRAAGR